MDNFEFAYHIDKITHLKQLGKYDEIRSYIAKQNHDTQFRLNGWASQLLSRYLDKDIKLTVPNTSRYCIEGWQAFYDYQYYLALECFIKAQGEPNWQSFAIDSSLGIAKVYTRTGHWSLAQAWCLYYLSQARKHSLAHVDIAKGYGALAEIFLRANKPQQALGCFQMAYHLMPLQSGQKARQYNFMASALLRHGEFLRAEALLHNSHQENLHLLKLTPNNMESQSGLLHSKMRLMFLSFLAKKEVDIDDDLQAILDNETSDFSQKTMPSGMIFIALGMDKLQQNNIKQASDYFYQAMKIFNDKMLFEYLWAYRLYDYCQSSMGISCNIDEAKIKQAQSLFNIGQIIPPNSHHVMDLTWQNTQLHNQGFHQLLNDKLSKDELISLWQQFFI